MILTVTANSTFDQQLYVPSFALNKTHRATKTVWGLGGKPTDASWVLGELGIPSRALGFFAGATGKRAEAMLLQKGVLCDFIWVEGETRINTIIVCEDGSGEATITTSTMYVASDKVDELRAQYAAALDETSVVVIGGTLPPGMTPSFYTEFIAKARGKGVPVIFDASEPFLSAGLLSMPNYIKPNRDELSALVGTRIETLEQAYAAGRDLLAQYNTAPIITLSEAGALAVLPDKAYFIPPLKIDVVSAAGAGDAVLAGLAASIHQRQPIEDGLRLGAAAAAAVCLLPGTGDCRREDVERLLPQVELIPYP